MLSEFVMLVEWLQMHIIPYTLLFRLFQVCSHERRGDPWINTWVEMKAKLEDKFLHVDYD